MRDSSSIAATPRSSLLPKSECSIAPWNAFTCDAWHTNVISSVHNLLQNCLIKIIVVDFQMKMFAMHVISICFIAILLHYFIVLTGISSRHRHSHTYTLNESAFPLNEPCRWWAYQNTHTHTFSHRHTQSIHRRHDCELCFHFRKFRFDLFLQHYTLSTANWMLTLRIMECLRRIHQMRFHLYSISPD